MPWLFFFAALAIPAFYAVGLLARPESHFTTADFWRFWVVHLWVEDFLELFTTVMVAYLAASGPAILRVRQGHQAAQAEAPHHSRLHRSGWSGLTLCSRLNSFRETKVTSGPYYLVQGYC